MVIFDFKGWYGVTVFLFYLFLFSVWMVKWVMIWYMDGYMDVQRSYI